MLQVQYSVLINFVLDYRKFLVPVSSYIFQGFPIMFCSVEMFLSIRRRPARFVVSRRFCENFLAFCVHNSNNMEIVEWDLISTGFFFNMSVRRGNRFRDSYRRGPNKWLEPGGECCHHLLSFCSCFSDILQIPFKWEIPLLKWHLDLRHKKIYVLTKTSSQHLEHLYLIVSSRLKDIIIKTSAR